MEDTDTKTFDNEEEEDSEEEEGKYSHGKIVATLKENKKQPVKVKMQEALKSKTKRRKLKE